MMAGIESKQERKDLTSQQPSTKKNEEGGEDLSTNGVSKAAGRSSFRRGGAMFHVEIKFNFSIKAGV